MERAWAQLALGAVVTTTGVVLAFQSPPRFYVWLVIGTFLIFDSIETMRFGTGIISTLRSRASLGQIGILYLLFALQGILGDLVYGLHITRLWTYPSYTTVDFIVLYAVIYPFGGLFTYSMLRSLVGPHRMSSRRASRPRHFLVAGALALVHLAFSVAIWIEPPHTGWAALAVFGAATLLTLGMFETLAAARGSMGPLQVVTRSRSVLGLVLILSLFGALLHELPNVLNYEWRYQNLPIELSVLRIPVLVIAGWPILLLVPWSMANATVPHGRDPLYPRDIPGSKESK